MVFSVKFDEFTKNKRGKIGFKFHYRDLQKRHLVIKGRAIGVSVERFARYGLLGLYIRRYGIRESV